MPELRKDPIVGRWVIISTERGKRPTSFKMTEKPAVAGGFCPLCVGNEDKTPPEVYALRRDGSKPNTPGWTLRVVSNKFPALVIEGNLKKQGEGMFMLDNGIVTKLLCVAFVAMIMLPAGHLLFPYVSDQLTGIEFRAIEAVVSATVGFGIYSAFG